MGEGDDNSYLDWLPAGWKMEVKVRKNGRKDRYYMDPSNEHKFSSKPEVLRYLKNVENNHLPCEESKKRGSPLKFVDKEVAVSKGLPTGWITKFRVTRSGSRKDPFYIDPDSGKQFSSMEEVFRHLNSRKTDNENNEKRASNLEEKTTVVKNGSGDQAIPSTPERRKLRSDSNKEEVQKLVVENFSQSKSNKLKPCKEKEKSAGISSPILPDLSEKVETAKKLVNTQEDISVEKTETELQEDILAVVTKNKRKITRENDLPRRRTSKRLAGVEVELPSVLELEPTQVRSVAIKPTGGEEHQTKCSTNCNKSSDNSVQKVKRVKTRDKDETVVDTLPQGVANVVPKQQAEQKVADVIIAEQKVADVIIAEQKDEQKAVNDALEEKNDIVSSLVGLWNDPCIEFAIKTLKGDLPIGNDENIAKDSVDVGPSSSSCQDSPLVGDLWSDPCFEFAVKTLTGDILPPIDATHFWSSKSGESNNVRLPNYKASAEFHQANGAYRHHNESTGASWWG